MPVNAGEPEEDGKELILTLGTAEEDEVMEGETVKPLGLGEGVVVCRGEAETLIDWDPDALLLGEEAVLAVLPGDALSEGEEEWERKGEELCEAEREPEAL